MPRGKNRKRENPAPTANPSPAAEPEGNGFVDWTRHPVSPDTFRREVEHERPVDLGPDPFAGRNLRETTLSREQRVKERAREVAAKMGLPYSDRIERLILEMGENGLGIGTEPDTRAAGTILAAVQRATLQATKVARETPAVKTALEGRTLITDRNGNTVFEGPGTLKGAFELMARTGRPIENVDFRPSTSNQSYPEWKEFDLSRAVFTGCKFETLSIMYSTLIQARFVNCEFIRTGFWHDKLYRARFDRCTFKGGDFVFSDLAGVAFEGCDLGPGYDFSHCKLQDIRFSDCRFNYQSHSQMAALLEADFWRTSGEVSGPEPSDNTKLVDRLALVRTLPSLAGNYCFNNLLTLDHPAKNWALAVIAKSLKPGDQPRLNKTLVYAFKRRGLLPEWWNNE